MQKFKFSILNSKKEIILWSLVYLATAISQLAREIPFGHDESVYALRARDFLLGFNKFSGAYWTQYRAPGISYLDSFFFSIFGQNDLVARFPEILFGLILIYTVWSLGLNLGTQQIARFSVLFLITFLPFIQASTRLLADVPGAAIAMFLVVYLVRKRTSGHWLVLLLVTFILGSLATVFRYGSLITFGPAMFGFLLSRYDTFKFELQKYRQVSVDFLLLLVAVISFAWLYFTTIVSGTSITPYRANYLLMSRKKLSPQSGWDDFISLVAPSSKNSIWLNWLVGYISIGIIAFAIILIFKKNQNNRQLGYVALISAIGSTSLIIIGIRLVAPNYLVLTAPFWALLFGVGASAAARNLTLLRVPHNMASLKGALMNFVLPLSIILILVGTFIHEDRSSNSKLAGTLKELKVAGLGIKNSGHTECAVLTSYIQSAWYSDCYLAQWFLTPDLEQKFDVENNGLVPLINTVINQNRDLVEWKNPEKVALYTVLVKNGKRQPSSAALDRGKYLFTNRYEVGETVSVASIDQCVIDATCPK